MSRRFRIALLALAVTAASTPLSMARAQNAAPPLTVKTFSLHHLQPHDAASLVSPYIQSRGGGVFEAGHDIQAITVRETPQVLARVDSLLHERDVAPPTIVFHFQLIAAEDSAVHDPAIARLDSTLRGLFKFAGYRLLSTGTAMAGDHRHFGITMGAGADRYALNGDVMAIDATGGSGSVQVLVQLARKSAGMYEGKPVPAEGLLSTGVTIPVGQTVVLGSAAPRNERRALILSVRPELVSAAKR